jgi:hypothetical protein
MEQHPLAAAATAAAALLLPPVERLRACLTVLLVARGRAVDLVAPGARVLGMLLAAPAHPQLKLQKEATPLDRRDLSKLNSHLHCANTLGSHQHWFDLSSVQGNCLSGGAGGCTVLLA